MAHFDGALNPVDLTGAPEDAAETSSITLPEDWHIPTTIGEVSSRDWGWLSSFKRWLGAAAVLGGYFAACVSVVTGWGKAGERIAASLQVSTNTAKALACIPLALFVILHGVPRVVNWFTRRYSITLTTAVPEEYFTTAPRTQFNSPPFYRADREHLRVHSWLERARRVQPVVFFTGESGAGKSSILYAHVIPQLNKTGVCLVLGRGMDPSRDLREQILTPGVIWEKPPTSNETDWRLIIRACARLKEDGGRRLLIVVDQFEELLSTVRAPSRRRRLLRVLVRRLAKKPLENCTLLLVLRKDYTPLLREFGHRVLPALQEDANWRDLKPFGKYAAYEFLSGGATIRPSLMNEIFRQIAIIEERRDMVRPVTLNMVGIMLMRKTVRQVTSLVWARRDGGFMPAYVSQAIREADRWGCARDVLRQLVTPDAETKRPQISACELAKRIRRPARDIEMTLRYLSRDGLVRCIDPLCGLWEVSHDFVARFVEEALRSWRATAWQLARRLALPLSLVCAAGVFGAARRGPLPKYMTTPVNEPLPGGETSLHLAAYSGDAAAVRWLLDHGADPEIRQLEHDRTPLMMAMMHGKLEVIKALVERHANVNATTSGGETMLHLATWYGHLPVCEWLVDEQRADPNAKRHGTEGLEFTPLHYAAIRGHSRVVEFLIRHKARVDEPSLKIPSDSERWGPGTPLAYAVEKGHYDTAKFLLESGASPKLARVKGYPVLHLAVLRDDPQMIQLLLKYNADLEARDSDGLTPLEFALGQNKLLALQTLRHDNYPPMPPNSPSFRVPKP